MRALSRLSLLGLLQQIVAGSHCRPGIVISSPEKAPLSASQPVDHGFASFSFPAHFLPDFAGNDSAPNIFSRDILDLLYKKTGVHPYIRVGGTSTDHLIYNASQEAAITLSKETMNGIPNEVYAGPSFFEAFNNFPGSLWSFQANLATQTPTALNNTIEACRIVMNKIGRRLIAFEIGNEPDLYAGTVRPLNYTVYDYVEEWLNYADSISKDVLQGNKFGLESWTFFQGLVFAQERYKSFTTYESNLGVHADEEVVQLIFHSENAFNAGIDKTGHIKSVSLHHYGNY